MAEYSGDAGDAMMTSGRPQWNANGMMFSTPDVDNDISPANCGWMGGWWHGHCTQSILNVDSDYYGGWYTGDPAVYDVQASRMLVKLN